MAEPNILAIHKEGGFSWLMQQLQYYTTYISTKKKRKCSKHYFKIRFLIQNHLNYLNCANPSGLL